MSFIARSASLSFFLLTAFTLSAAAQVPPTKKPAKKPGEGNPAAAKSQRYVMTQEPLYTGLLGKVEGGVAQVTPPSADALGPGPLPLGIVTEGLFLAISFPDPRMPMVNATLSRVRVKEVGEGGAITLELADAAAKGIKPGAALMLFRPAGSTTAIMQAAPDFAPLSMGGDDPAKVGRDAGLKIGSQNNLKQIALAMHNFNAAFGKFPPAVVFGPDGKPWHSWRVLILPFIEQQQLYQQYKFDEPWDGPNNSKLLDKIPDVYRDPIHGQNKEHFTHYAAITGEGTAFPEQGLKFDGKADTIFKDLTQSKGATSFQNFLDGTSNSLLVGTIGPEHKIPWTRPLDIVVGQKLPGLGQKGGFAAPFLSGERKAGLFAFADGHVQEIRDDIKPEIFFQLATIGGLEVVRPEDVPGNNEGAAVGRQVPVIEIRAGKNGPTAHIVMEAMAERAVDTLPPPETKATEPAPKPVREKKP